MATKEIAFLPNSTNLQEQSTAWIGNARIKTGFPSTLGNQHLLGSLELLDDQDLESISSPDQPFQSAGLADQRTLGSESYQKFYNETEIVVPSIAELLASINKSETPKTSILQIWEGRVLNADFDEDCMNVLLTDKTGSLPDHRAQISLEWVSEQDHDLIYSGSIFYLTLYKEVRKGSVRNSQELRFRRLPNWSRSQINNIHSGAEELLKRFSTKPISQD